MADRTVIVADSGADRWATEAEPRPGIAPPAGSRAETGVKDAVRRGRKRGECAGRGAVERLGEPAGGRTGALIGGQIDS